MKDGGTGTRIDSEDSPTLAKGSLSKVTEAAFPSAEAAAHTLA